MLRRLGAVAQAAVLILLTLPAQGAYQKIYEPKPADTMPVHIYRLDNGLTVYLTQNSQEPRFYSEIVVRAGSKNDPAETTGLAHYLEHLMFKGSQQLGTTDFAAEKPHMDRIRDLYEQHFKEEEPAARAKLYEEINRQTQEMARYAIPNELDKIYKAFGATDINAHTSTEETVYKVSLPKNRFEQWAALEADRFANPVFRLFVTELETVYEEKNRAMDDKETLLFEGVMQRLYKQHPYGQQTTLGRPEHLKRPSIKNIETFYRTNYVPANMAIVVSGDLAPDEAIKTIDRHFSQWKNDPLPQKKSWPEEPLKEVERVTIPYQGEEKVMLAFRTAPQSSEDKEALQLFDMILDNSVAGLINLNLNQAQKVREAGSFPMLMNDYSAQFLWGVPKAGQTLDEVERLLLDQIQLIKSGQFDEWIIPAIVNDFEKNQKLSIEENAGRVAMLRESFVAEEPWPEAMLSLERMRQLKKEDVVRVANAYFNAGHISAHRVDQPREVPFIEKPKLEKVEIDPSRQSQFGSGIAAMKVTEIEPEFIDPSKDLLSFEDRQGTRYYYTPNPINDLFTLSIRIEKGLRHDPRLPIAVQLLEKAGTERLSPQELKKEWYRLGTDFSINAGDNETIITISGLDRNLAESLQLLDDLLSDPRSDQATLDQLVDIVLAQREDAKKDQNTLLAAVTQYNRYGSESRFLKMLPTADLRALKVEELIGAISGLMNLKKNILYVGSQPAAEVLHLTASQFLHAGTLEDPPPYSQIDPRDPDQTEVYFFDKELAQSLIRLEFPDGQFSSETIPAVEVFNDYFDGGMGGLVFQELREARALAYIVGAQYLVPERRVDKNLMIGVIHTQPDKAHEAVQAFAELMDKMPASQERFQETLTSVENQYRTAHVGFRGILDSVVKWERLGLPIDPRREWFRQVREVTLDDLLKFQLQHIQDRPKMISIVGDSKRINLQDIEQIGPIKKLTLGDLFVK